MFHGQLYQEEGELGLISVSCATNHTVKVFPSFFLVSILLLSSINEIGLSLLGIGEDGRWGINKLQ